MKKILSSTSPHSSPTTAKEYMGLDIKVPTHRIREVVLHIVFSGDFNLDTLSDRNKETMLRFMNYGHILPAFTEEEINSVKKGDLSE